jgi:Reverse transcriptase (RNA-dependent DNA polymerase)
MIFLDIKKAYNTLDRDQTLSLLQQYAVGNNICTIIQTVWNKDTMIPCQWQYYGQRFKADSGVWQGDIISPTIFYIVVDAVICECEIQSAHYGQPIFQFYVDYGVIASHNSLHAQQTLNLFIENFKRFGLYMDTTKTETMTVLGTPPVHKISSNAYFRMITQQGPTDRERQQLLKYCIHCNKQVQAQSM